jgi:serine/threonine protein kinase
MKTRSLAPHSRDLGAGSSALRSRAEREFELVRRLYGGRPGEWWLATRPDGHQKAVLRFMSRDAVSDQQLKTLERDLGAASRLPPHPHIAPILASDLTGHRMFFAAAHVEGDDLASLIAATGPMPPDAALECLRQALAGLQFAHANRVAHGDLTASDLFLNYDGVLIICHWGCSEANADCEFSSAAANDLRRMANIATLLLTGREADRCVTNGCESAADRAVVSVRQACPEAPQALLDLLARLAAAGTDRGIASADEAVAALEQVRLADEDAAGEETQESPAPTSPQVSDQPREPQCEATTPTQHAVATLSDPRLEDNGQPFATPQPETSAVALPRSTPVWLYGTAAAAAAAALAVAGYLLLQ